MTDGTIIFQSTPSVVNTCSKGLVSFEKLHRPLAVHPSKTGGLLRDPLPRAMLKLLVTVRGGKSVNKGTLVKFEVKTIV